MKNILNKQVRLSRNKIGFNASLSSFNDISKFKVTNFIIRNFNYIASYIKKEEFLIYIKNLDFSNLTDHDQNLFSNFKCYIFL